jgi:hypothetical protein
MNENDVTFFSTLLNVEAEEVKKAVEDGSLGEKVKALNLMDNTQVETLKENHAKEVRATYTNELVEQAKRGELPGDLYKPIKGAVHEMLEKDLSKEYGVNEFDGVKDLVAKAIANKAGQSDDKKLQEAVAKFEELQQVNERLVKEKEEGIAKANTEKDQYILNQTQAKAVSEIPFDFSDVEDSKLADHQKSTSEIVNSVFNARYELVRDGDTIAVKSRSEEKILTNPNTLAPVPVADVMKTVASELNMKLKSPETGGQGGQSSGGKSSRFKDVDEFMEHCKNNNIVATSPEGLKLLKESGLKLI